MLRILLIWLINAVAVYATASLLPGIAVRGFSSALIVAIVLGLVNALIKPVLVFFSIPFIIVTLGLFMFVINALLLQLSAALVKGFEVQNFWWAMLGSVVISMIAWAISGLLNI